MVSADVQAWLRKLDVYHQLSSAYFPHANSRSEIAVKSTKRMLQDCVTRKGGLDTDKYLKAVLQDRNTPHQDCKKSPAQMVFGRSLRDFTPTMPYKYSPSADWCISQELRERLLSKSREQDGERLARSTRQLEELPVGTPVVIQNQTGRYPTKWDKTGVIVEIRPHSQLVIKVDGSRRLTLRNRRFVRELKTGDNIKRTGDEKFFSPSSCPVSSPTTSQTTRQDPLPPIETPASTAMSDLPEFKRDTDQPVIVETDGNVEDLVEGGMDGDIEHVDYDEVGGVREDIPVGASAPDTQHEPVVDIIPSPDRPNRTRKPNVKYPSAEYDLSLVRHRSRRQISRAG